MGIKKYIGNVDGANYFNDYLTELDLSHELGDGKYFVLLPENVHKRNIYPHYDYFNPKAGRWRFYPIENELVPKDIASISQYSEEALRNSTLNLKKGGIVKPAKINKSFNQNNEWNGYWEEISKEVDRSLSEMMIQGLSKSEVILLTDLISETELDLKGLGYFLIENKVVYYANSNTNPEILSKFISSLARPHSFLMIKLLENILNKHSFMNNLKNSSLMVTLCFDGESYLIWER